MPNAYADTPRNPWNIKVPAAAYGASQLPIPQPATMGEVKTEAFHQRLKAAVSAQLEANASARASTQARADAEPYRPAHPHRWDAVSPPAAETRRGSMPDHAASPHRGAATGEADLSLPSAGIADQYAIGASVARATLAASGHPIGQAGQPSSQDGDEGDAAFAAGAATARALLGHGEPAPERKAAPPASAAPAAANPSAEHEAGAAEARRLLGL